MRGVAGVPDGIYSAPSQKGTAAKAILNLEGTNVKTGNIKKSIAKEDEIDISTVQVAAQPSGWTPRNTADGEPKEWSSEDGLVVRQFADSYVAYDTDSAGNPANEIVRGESWADIQKATADYEKRDTPAPAASQDTNARSSDRATSTQLQPTDSLKEAKATGRPLSILRPGTMPKRTQAAYDSIVQSTDGGYKKARELLQKHKELFDRVKEKEASKGTYTSEENAILNEFNDSLIVTESQWNELSEAIKEDYTAAKDGEESAFTEQEVADIVEAITRPLDYRHKLVVNNARAIKDGGQDIYSDELRLQNSAEVLEKADIAIAFPLEVLEKLITDGRFKTQFETNTSGGTLYTQGRMQGDIAQFGYHPRNAPETRPVYGYLTKGGVIDDENFDAVQMYGELQFVLKKDAHSRATYTTQNSLGSGLVPSPMGVPSKDASGAVGNPMAIYAEAQVHGGVSLSDVDYVVVNVGERQPWATHKVSEEQFESISKMLESVGIRVVPVRDGEVVNTWDGGKIVSGPKTQSAEKEKTAKSSKEILDEASALGIKWQGKTVGTSKEEIDRQINSSVKTLRKSKELGLTDIPELSDNIKKIFNDYADGKISLKGMREAILFTDPKDEGLRQWAFGNRQLPIGWRVAAAKEIALSQNDTELVKKIDDFIKFMGDIDNASDEKLEELIRKASVDFGKNMGSPIIQTPDVKRIIRGAGGVTVHDSDERKLDNLSGTTSMGDSITITARRKVETMYGLPFTGENTPEDKAITAMRPISGHSLPKDSYLAREKRMKKIYGEDFVTMYDFPIGSDVADLSQTAKYGRSHIVLSDAVNERTKVVNGDAVTRFGSSGAAVADLESIDEAGIAYADPIGMLFSSMTGDSGASIAGPLDPSFKYNDKYNETATLGTFDPSEVRAVYIADIGQTRREIGDVPQGMNPDFYGNLSVIFDFARTRDEILDSRGTELVAQIGEPRGANGQMGALEYLHPENVELFNSSMTSAWLDRYDEIFGDIPREVLIPKDEPETTPYEAYLRAKITQFDKSGKGTLKENAGTFGETRDGKEFGLDVIKEELDRAISARKNRTKGEEKFSSDGSLSPEPEPAQSADRLPNNSVSLEKEASMSFVPSDYELEKAKAELENPVNAAIGQVWNIGGKKIHFGMEKDRNVVKYGEDMDDVEIVPINPYKIAGVEMGSKEGKELALKWAYARSALSSNDGTGYKSTSEVDALLYAGARGDEASLARLEELAEIGKEKVEKIRSERQAALKDIEPKSETNLKEQIAKGLVSEKDQKAAERILGGSIDDLYVVHQTEYAFPIDDEGNIALKPASAYPTTLEDGTEIFVPRHTIHTALNHVVDPIKERGWPPNSHIAIIPLRALLEANPGSIDNILAEDTFFTPEAGGVLKFPAGSYKTISNATDIVSAREQVSEAIRELARLGSYGAQGDEIKPIIFEEGIMEISNTDARRAAFNALLQRISVDLGITNQIHMGTNSSLLDRAGDQDAQVSQNIERFFTPDFLSNLSINQIMRLTVGRDRSLYSAETQETRAAQQQQSVTQPVFAEKQQSSNVNPPRTQ